MVGHLCLAHVSDDFVIRLLQSFVSTCQRLIFRTETTTEYSLSTWYIYAGADACVCTAKSNDVHAWGVEGETSRSGLQDVARCNCSISCRRLPACLSRRPLLATIGRHRHVLRSTNQHTAPRSELRSRWTTALEQSASQDSPARQRHRRILSAAEVVFV